MTVTSASPGKASRAFLASLMLSESINGSPSIFESCANCRTGWQPATPSRSQEGETAAPSRLRAWQVGAGPSAMSEVLARGAGGSLIGAVEWTGVPTVPSALLTGMRFTMANPFEDPDASYQVLVNHEGQHSLCPAGQPTPDGWTVAQDTDSRAACLEYIEKNWTDMRPLSLIKAQDG